MAKFVILYSEEKVKGKEKEKEKEKEKRIRKKRKEKKRKERESGGSFSPVADGRTNLGLWTLENPAPWP